MNDKEWGIGCNQQKMQIALTLLEKVEARPEYGVDLERYQKLIKELSEMEEELFELVSREVD